MTLRLAKVVNRLPVIVLAMVFTGMWSNSIRAEDAMNRMSIIQAQPLIFPNAASFRDVSFRLTDAQKDAISEITDLHVRFANLPLWKAIDAEGKVLGVIVVDKVIGKHEFITYALGISHEGVATAPFILDYRESYGQQVAQDQWRNQFSGKTRHDNLKVGQTIDNISGATLSCVNITNGIKRLLVTFDLVIKGNL